MGKSLPLVVLTGQSGFGILTVWNYFVPLRDIQPQLDPLLSALMVKPLQVVVKMAQLGFGNCEAVATEGTVKTNLTKKAPGQKGRREKRGSLVPSAFHLLPSELAL